MISPSDNDMEELKSNDNTSLVMVSFSGTINEVNTSKKSESLGYAKSWWWCPHWSRCLH